MPSSIHAAVLSCHTDELSGVAVGYTSDLSDHFAAVLRKLDIPPKQVEDWWHCGHTLVSLVLTGERPLTDEKIAKCPVYVQAALAREWCESLGLLVGPRAAAIGALTAACHLLGVGVDERLPVKAGPPAKATLDAPAQPMRREKQRC